MKKFNESFSFVSKCDSLERDRLKFLRSSKRRNGITKDGVSNGTIQPRGKIGFGHGPFVTSSRTRNRRATSTVRPSTVVPVHRSMEKNTWIQGRLRRSRLITIGATIDTKPVKVQRIPILPRVVELANVSKRRPVRPMSLTRQPRFVSSPFGCIRIAEQRYPFVAFIHPSNVYNRIIDQLNATFVFGLTPFLALSYRERKNGKNRDDFNLEQ